MSYIFNKKSLENVIICILSISSLNTACILFDKILIFTPDSDSQTLPVKSVLSVSISLESLLLINFADVIFPVWPIRVWQHFPKYASHTHAVESELPVRIFLESWLNSAELIPFLCPCNVCIQSPLNASQIHAVLSLLPVSIYLESWLNSAELISFLWPVSAWIFLPLNASQTRAVRSNYPFVSIYLLS